MVTLKLAWKNLGRNRNRTVITISAIFFAVLLSVVTSSLRAGIFDNLVNNLTRSYVGKIQVHARGYWDEPILENSFSRAATQEDQLLNRFKMRSVLPRIESFVLVASEKFTKGGQLVGIDPVPEDRMGNIRSRIVQGRYLTASDRGLLLGEGVLHRIGARLGDTLVLLGQGYQGSMAAGKYPVLGVLHFGSPELNNNLIYLPLLAAQDFLQAPGRLTAYVMDPIQDQHLQQWTDSLRRVLGSDYEVMAWSDMLPDIRQHIETDTRNMRIVQWILYLLVSFGIFGTLLMMMSERVHEFGMLLALGMRKMQLAWVLVWESLFVFLMGIFFGTMAGIPIVSWMHRYPIRIRGSIAEAYERFGFEAVFPTSLQPRHFWEQGITVLIIGTLLSFYLVFRIFRLDPVAAMR